MSDFSGRTPQKLDVQIGNNGFFPPLNLGDLQEAYRIPSDYRQHTIGAQTVAALIEVNRALNARVCEWQRLGYTELAAVPAVELGELHELVELYKVAVFARAKAKLIRQYPSINRRDRQDHPGREWDDVERDFIAESDNAIAQLLGNAPALQFRAEAL